MCVLLLGAFFIASLTIYLRFFRHPKERLTSDSNKISQIPKTPAESVPNTDKLSHGWLVRPLYDGHLLLATYDQRPSWDQADKLMRGYKAVELHCDNFEGIERLSLAPVDLTLIPSSITAEDYKHLQALKNMSTLELHNIKTPDLSGLSALHNLKSLSLGQTDVSDVSALRSLKQLKLLSLFASKVTDITPLEELSELTRLDLSHTDVSNIDSVRKLSSLINLDLEGTRVADISALSELRKLEILNLFCTNVADITPLVHLERLKTLDLRETKVADVSSLAGIRSLEYLDLQGMMKVQGISVLRNLKHLSIVEPNSPVVDDDTQ
jgi:Leucine-rich repeat (LRR) protein